ncbi:ADP-ribosylglycohydrolase family protein [Streptomyces albipurpureus]|uniref:ADP-ribosylglycohydrolase family protein n=1 Tax=Streptomyces albipurpureus TaxID=2897419 RepID=A0ABT0UQF7_9ACTN|nr:ADP-ribosylglycohydrolase family protein [Streptomyces sp. CWNU-1]MCM2390822.1 ADP-ribosylglycohydrolase family protein [Streptomyces sp. CWNU-1]
MDRSSWERAVARRSRIRGCLLGGAIGDALGNPIEFQSLATIEGLHGEKGVTGFVPDFEGMTGRITDDTQMTLFTVEGLIRARATAAASGIGGAEVACTRHAYQRWLETQNYPAPPTRAAANTVRTGWLRTQPFLYARRAPGHACLTGVAQQYTPDPERPLGRPGEVNPQSKGCGTVMRSAPFGLVGAEPQQAFELAAHCAQITHGHPTGYYSAGAFAAIIAHVLEGETTRHAVQQTMALLSAYPGHEETHAALGAAVTLAAAGGPPNARKVETLGGGWVAEEALAIAVYCALAHPDDVAEALLLAVNHSGDSDSTGAVCGNLVGARDGEVGLPASWVVATEGRGVITVLADDLSLQFERTGTGSVDPVHPYDRYPHN